VFLPTSGRGRRPHFSLFSPVSPPPKASDSSSLRCQKSAPSLSPLPLLKRRHFKWDTPSASFSPPPLRVNNKGTPIYTLNRFLFFFPFPRNGPSVQFFSFFSQLEKILLTYVFLSFQRLFKTSGWFFPLPLVVPPSARKDFFLTPSPPRGLLFFFFSVLRLHGLPVSCGFRVGLSAHAPGTTLFRPDLPLFSGFLTFFFLSSGIGGKDDFLAAPLFSFRFSCQVPLPKGPVIALPLSFCSCDPLQGCLRVLLSAFTTE